MKSVSLMIVILFSLFLKSTLSQNLDDSAFGGPVCPRGQVSSQCFGHCPPACRDETRACSAQCVPGCVCAFNWVFDFTGRCIPRSFCCPQGRVESECNAHCQPTCDDPQGTRPCTLQCVRGCVCAPGTVLDRRGRCVPLSQC